MTGVQTCALPIYNQHNEKVMFNPLDWIQNRSGVENQVRQMSIISKNNIRKIISASASEIKDINGNFKGFIFVFRDITERLKFESIQALSQKMESVGQLAAGIAHEINTPMQFVGDNTYFLKDAFSALLEYLETLKNFLKEPQLDNNYNLLIENLKEVEENLDIEFLTEEIPIAIDRTMSGIERVSKIVLAMKDFAHPSGKQKSFNDINKGIDVTVNISRNEWKYVSDIELDLDPNLPTVKCSMDEINQVLLNMIINSSHAIGDVVGKNPEEKGKIFIKTFQEDEFLVILIKDTGSGIDENHISRIFDPFFTTKEVGKGTGQGLAISHDIIVNKHNGIILVDSKIGEGTTFTIKLPINSQDNRGDNEN